MYLDYREYKEMGGLLDETAFKTYCFEATQKIRTATFNRVVIPNAAVKNCTFRLIELFEMSDPAVDKILSSSHDGLSQTFVRVSAEEMKAKIRDIIRIYLINEKTKDGLPLLYCGVKII